MSLFAGTTDYYREYRPGIPQEVADILEAAAPQHTPRRLLDVGTGTGLVVEALLGRFDDIVASDTDGQMIATAQAALRPLLPVGTSLSLIEIEAERFEPRAGWQADLVTICRAFHWLDQGKILHRLDAQVSPGGVVAIFGDNSFWTAGSDWKDAVRSVIKDFLGEERRAGSGTFKHHDRPYSEILRESPFSVVEEMRVPEARTWSRESIFGYLYSTTFAAPQLFDDRLEEFESAITRTLRGFSDDDTYVEDNEFLIRLGRRPS
jgi:trans-aconitate methyltransferase